MKISSLLITPSDLRYLWECRTKRKHRYADLFEDDKILDCDLFFREKPHCKFWVAYEKGKGYETFENEFGGKSHDDWCIYTHKDEEGKQVKDLLRKRIGDIGDRLHWKCHHIPQVIEERINDILELKSEIVLRSRGIGDSEIIEIINELSRTEEQLKKHYQEFMNYRYEFSQQIDAEENKKDRASALMLGIIAIVPIPMALGISIYFYILPILVFIWYFNLYLKSVVRVNEIKDAMYLCLGIDEDHPQKPGGKPETEEEVPEDLLKRANEIKRRLSDESEKNG